MDKDIFEQLYRQHYAAALLYAQGLCRSRPLAEDMVQEAFCRAWLSLPDHVVSFRSWLFRVLRNLIIDHLRRQKHLSDEDVPETADAAVPADAPQPVSASAAASAQRNRRFITHPPVYCCG